MAICRFVVILAAGFGLILGVPVHALTNAADAVPLSVDADRLITLETRINGAGPFRFMLDTGSSATAISRKLMRKLQLGPVTSAEVVSVSGQSARDVTRLDVMSVGARSRRGLLATVLEDSDLAALGPNIHGIVGQNFLADEAYTIDYRGRKLTWRADADGDAAAAATLEIRMSEGRWLAALPQGTDGRVLWFVPDSGAEALVVFHRGAPSAIPMRSVRCCAGITTVNGSADARIAVLREFSVGSRVLRNLQAVIVNKLDPNAPAGDGLLPLSMFSSVSFEPGQKTLRVTF